LKNTEKLKRKVKEAEKGRIDYFIKYFEKISVYPK